MHLLPRLLVEESCPVASLSAKIAFGEFLYSLTPIIKASPFLFDFPLTARHFILFQDKRRACLLPLPRLWDAGIAMPWQAGFPMANATATKTMVSNDAFIAVSLVFQRTGSRYRAHRKEFRWPVVSNARNCLVLLSNVISDWLCVSWLQ